MTKSKRIVVIGSSNTDMILKTTRIPKPGETILGGDFSMAPGGKGANQAVAAARAGAAVTLVARLGNDIFGEQAIAGFQQEGINTDHLIRDASASSGVALIFVDREGENSIGVGSGANAHLSEADVWGLQDLIASADILLMQLEVPLEAVTAAATIAYDHHVTVILNPAPARELPDELLPKISLLTPNETETELLTGMPVQTEGDCLAAATHLQKRGIRSVIITLGARGVYALSPEFTGLMPAYTAPQVVDTTAAGDVFNGALAVALVHEMPFEKAIQFANAAGALAVSKLGAQPSAPYRQEILNLMSR